MKYTVRVVHQDIVEVLWEIHATSPEEALESYYEGEEISKQILSGEIIADPEIVAHQASATV